MQLFKEKIVRRPTTIMVSKNFYNPSDECWSRQHLRVEEIQKITKGKGAYLFFIDDGVGVNNELQHLVNTEGNKWVSKGNKLRSPIYSFLKSDNPFGDHSTNGATIIAGNTLGIFPEMEIGTAQVLDPESGAGQMHDIVSAVELAISLNIPCINLSLSSNYYDKPLEAVLKKYCSDGKRIATIAAGNDGAETDFPAYLAKRIKGVLSVAATQIDEQGNVTIALFTSTGTISLAAPGHALKTMNLNNRIDYVSGTSFAAPIVGSTIAVAQMLNPELTQDQVMHYFKTTSNRLDRDGFDRQGYGSIDIPHFLKKAIANEQAPKIKVEKKKGILDKLKSFFGS